MAKFFVRPVLIVLLLSACATRAKYMAKIQTWVGSSADELISQWGPPSSSTPLSDGGRVLEYVKSKVVHKGGGTLYMPMNTYQSGTVNAFTPGGYGTANYNGTVTQNVPINIPASTSIDWCKTRFTTNAKSIITKCAIEGNDCTSF